MLQFYIPWEIDGLIGFELLRNLLLALCGVFLISFVLLGDLPATVAVSLSVLLSLVDTAGFLHLLWPSTKVNIVSSIDLIMTVGVGVDYAAHVALAHLTAPPSAEDPASFALTSIGPAVLNGGATTFLAVSAVSFSKTEAFQIFFRVRICISNLLKLFLYKKIGYNYAQIFFLMVLFGLFHGLVFLPILLRLLNPKKECHQGVTQSVLNRKSEEEDRKLLLQK